MAGPRSDRPGIEDTLGEKPNTLIYADRLDAGQQLGEELRLRGYDEKPVVVLAIPRGGVPVGHAVAKAIDAPLGLVIARRLTVPGDPATGFGAVTPDGALLLNLPQVERLQLEVEEIKRVTAQTLTEVRRQMKAYCGESDPPDLANTAVILVDDGLASGFTMLAAVRAVHHCEPGRIVVAVPVSSSTAVDRLMPQVDELICLAEQDDTSFAIAHAYQNYSTPTDEQVQLLLQNLLASEQS